MNTEEMLAGLQEIATEVESRGMGEVDDPRVLAIVLAMEGTIGTAIATALQQLKELDNEPGRPLS